MSTTTTAKTRSYRGYKYVVRPDGTCECDWVVEPHVAAMKARIDAWKRDEAYEARCESRAAAAYEEAAHGWD